MWENTVSLAGTITSILGFGYGCYEIGYRRNLRQKSTKADTFDQAIAKLLKYLESQESEDVDLVGYSVHALLDTCEPYLKRVLKDKKTVRVLMLSPYSFGLREKSFMEAKYHKLPIHDLRKRNSTHIIETGERLLSLQDRVMYQENLAKAALYLRVYNQFPFYRGIICHGQRAVAGSYIQVPHEPGRAQPHWVLTPNSTSGAPVDYKSLVNYFNYLWEFRSRPWGCECLIFDLYETLAFVDPVEKQRVRKTMAEQLGITERSMVELWEQTTEQSNSGYLATTVDRILRIQELLNLPANIKQALYLANLEETLVRKHCKVYEDVIEALEILRQKGYRLALQTNCSPSVLGFLSSSELSKYFDVIGLSFQMRHVKPEPESYAWITSQLGIPANCCTFVGDGRNQELAGAKKAGMLPIKLSRPDAPMTSDCEAELTVRGLHDLLDTLESDQFTARMKLTINKCPIPNE